jgi:16S rRNA (guanine966-N2)-methyltransferase
MRVIAGSAGGVRLAVPKRGVRPTMDRVKAAIFSSLGDAIVGARVLDLFAGTGALGIEALSRGASSAVFVEENRQSVEVLEKNLTKTKLRGRIRNQDVFDFLRKASNSESYQIIFADPPYEKTIYGEDCTEKLLTNEALLLLLAAGGTLVLEKQPSETLLETTSWRIIRRKTYGATEVLFLEQPAIGIRGEGSPRREAKPRRAAASKRGKRASFNRQSKIV